MVLHGVALDCGAREEGGLAVMGAQRGSRGHGSEEGLMVMGAQKGAQVISNRRLPSGSSRN